MKKLYALQAVGVAVLLGLCWWKNSFSYPLQSKKWIALKSLLDGSLIITCALYLPAMLVAWAVLLLTRTIKGDGLRVTASVLIGIFFGTISGLALEVLCAFSVISVDLVTGAQGAWGRWRQGPPNTFMAWLGESDARVR